MKIWMSGGQWDGKDLGFRGFLLIRCEEMPNQSYLEDLLLLFLMWGVWKCVRVCTSNCSTSLGRELDAKSRVPETEK